MKSLFSRKAQGLPLEFIIIAALGLIVLVVAGLIFMRESGKSSDTLRNCFTQGGQCAVNESTCRDTNKGQIVSNVGGCESQGKDAVCCVTLRDTKP